MKKVRLSLAICAILVVANGLAQENYMPLLLKESIKLHAAQFKSGIVGSYPRHTEEFNWETDWVLFRTIETSYTSFGEPAVIEYNQNGNRTRKLYSYNDQHRETEVIIQAMTDGVWVNQSRQVTSYNNLGYELEYHNEQWNGTGWALKEGTQMSYEMDGDRVKIVILKEWNADTSTWVNSIRETYSYSVTGSNYSSLIMEMWDNAWVPSLKMDITWNGNQMSESLSYSYSDNVWTLTGKNVYEFQANNSTITTSYTYLGPENWMPSSRITLTFDSHGNATLAQMEMYITSWTVFSATRFQLTNSGNNLTERITQSNSMNVKKEVFSNFASLSTDVTLLPDAGLTVFPNPAGKQAIVRLSLLKAGSVTLSLISVTGQEIFKENVTANGSDFNYQLNLNGVRPGSYLIIARDTQGNEIGKARFIKE